MAGKGSKALKGAATGAAAGAVLGPWGAAAGGLIGGAIGWFSGDDPKAPTYSPNHASYDYGLGPSSSYASLQSANNYDPQQRQLQALRNEAYNRAAPTQAIPQTIQYEASGGQAYLHGAGDAARSQQALDLSNLDRTNQALNNFSQGGSQATQGAIQQAADMGAHQQYGMARSQPGGGGAALRNAAVNAAGIMNNAGNTAAIASQQDRAQQLAALQAEQSGRGMAAGYSGQMRGADQAFAQAQAGQANYDAAGLNQFRGQQQQLQYNLGQNNLQSALQTRGQNDAMTLGLTGAAQNYDQLRNGLAAQQLGSQESYEQARAAGAGIAQSNQQFAANQSRQDNRDLMNGISQGAGAYAAMQGAGSPDTVNNFDASTKEFSDERLKESKKTESALSSALGTLGNAPGFSYVYKNPDQLGAAHGTQVSSMAQDLERGPLGERLVVDTPQGKMVDYKEVMKMTPGAITELNRKVSALERAMGKAA